MAGVTNVNIPFSGEEIYPMHKLRLSKKWSWKNLFINTTSYYLENNPVEEDKLEEEE